MKERIGNLLLVVFSVGLTLILCEFGLRWVLFSKSDSFSLLKNPSLYSNHIQYKGDHFYNEDYWKLNYLFFGIYNFENPNSLLGWTGFFDRMSLDHFQKNEIEQRRPVLLYGDSFAMCIDSVKCFEDYLNGDEEFSSNHFLLNYGVGGYGVDQIYLLFNETVDRFNNPFVIFSVLTSDLDRSMLGVRDGQKPYFIKTDTGLSLQGTPITLSSKEYFAQNPPEIDSYVWNAVKSSKFYPSNSEERARHYMEENKSLNKAILLKAFEKLKKLDDYVVLIFHPQHLEENNWRLNFLRDLCIENEMNYICEVDIKKADSKGSKANSLYAIPGDGHPTSYANALVSNELKNIILDRNFADSLYMNSGKWNDKKTRIDSYIQQIKNSPEWLESVSQKATDRGIPIDSMIYLDAKYMVEQEDL